MKHGRREGIGRAIGTDGTELATKLNRQLDVKEEEGKKGVKA